MMPDNQTEQENSSNSAAILRELNKRLNDVIDLLRVQRDTLRDRGVNLPSGSLDSLRTLKKRLEILTRSITESQQELRSLRALAKTTALINSSQNSDEVLNEVMDTVIALTGAERGYIMLKNEATSELEYRVARGMDQETLSADSMIVSKTIVNNVADTGESVLSDNASQDERYQGQHSIVNFQLRSILAVPLKVRNEVIGVVYCDNRFLQGLFKQTELEVLTAFANQAAVAIENARLFEATQARIQEVSAIKDRMDNLFTSIANGVLTIDKNGQVLISNATMQAIAHQETTMIGKALSDVMPVMPEIFHQVVQLVQETGEQHTLDIELDIAGETCFWTMIASPLRDDNGIQGVAMVIDDITQQKRSDSQLKETKVYLPSALVDSMGSIDIEKIESEEREISAMFADVRGFTTFSESLDPQELMRVINKYLTIASDSISLFEGIVDKYMGDAVTGLFNTQLNPQPDHANRAIQAAMQLVLDLHAMHEILPEGERLFYGIGVHSGPAVLGNTGGKGRREFSALGEAPDICKYLQEQAGPGEVIISEDTARMVSNQWDCEPTPVKRYKKGYEQINCYRVIRRKKGATSAFIDEELLALLADEEED
jgi:PAS domain S-box-containing protein